MIMPNNKQALEPETSTWYQILNLKIVIEKNKEHNNDLFFCFIDYKKTFDTADHNILWNNINKFSCTSASFHPIFLL